jgi:RNA polymerase sigma-70 factor, ECF subfamily
MALQSKEQEFVAIISHHQGLIIKVARMYSKSPDEEKDLSQEIVLQLWRSFGSYKGDAKITTWMYRVAINTAISLFRKSKNNINTQSLGDFNCPDTPMDYEIEHQLASLYRLIKQLGEIEQAIVMMYLDDLSYKEIAENIGISEGNARVKMNRLKNTLKTLVQQEED